MNKIPVGDRSIELAPMKVRMSIGILTVATVAAFALPFVSSAEETGLRNNLSVPTIFVPSVGVGSQVCTADDDTVLPDPANTSAAFPGYWVQGEAVWQADCDVVADNVLDATAAWGDNLAGQASVRVGNPVRVELALLADAAAYSMTGFEVEKLQPELLDRESAYGTNDAAGITPYSTIGVWNAGVTLSITGPSTVSVPFGAELNSTGRVVYGYNWRPNVAGTYTITANVPTVRLIGTDLGTFNAHAATIVVEVTERTSGGSGGGSGNGQFHGSVDFGSGRTADAVFDGGTVSDLIEAVESVGGTGAWVRGDDGDWTGLVVGAPDFVNGDFHETFGNGIQGPTEVVVVR